MEEMWSTTFAVLIALWGFQEFATIFRTLQMLKDLGASPKMAICNRYGLNSPISGAIRAHSLEGVEFLLSLGFDVNGADVSESGYPLPLVDAVNIKSQAICKLLLNRGANINAYGSNGSALASAAIIHDGSFCRLLLDHGADVNMSIPTGSFRTALVAACSIGYYTTTKLLLDHGAASTHLA